MNNTLSVATCTTDEGLDPNYGDIAHENWQCELCRSSALVKSTPCPPVADARFSYFDQLCTPLPSSFDSRPLCLVST